MMINWYEEIKTMQGWSYGDSAAMADELAAQTAAGRNLANCFLWTENCVVPGVGQRSYVKNSTGHPVCVVEVARVETLPFHAVSSAFARAEGYATLAEWQSIHRAFFGRLNPSFNMNTQVVCQWFRLLHVF